MTAASIPAAHSTAGAGLRLPAATNGTGAPAGAAPHHSIVFLSTRERHSGEQRQGRA
ncbi:hypothetical protein R6V09_20645 [Streptomyces sp. W16]|uniref:hypothetical protein n=1 Tax=Streptomyces sp. W16 TaxID=3076631 RepID=UPI00295B2C60|nr:hypothetical protein [Streptomyces sp. W16]MDV9172503.1 hypothetical protein [Streptomyces sp. W16]